MDVTKAFCLEMALTVAARHRGLNHMKIAEEYERFIKSDEHRLALNLAVRFPMNGETILQTASAYLEYFGGPTEAPAQPEPEDAEHRGDGPEQAPAPEPQPETATNTTGQAKWPRKTGRRGGPRKHA